MENYRNVDLQLFLFRAEEDVAIGQISHLRRGRRDGSVSLSNVAKACEHYWPLQVSIQQNIYNPRCDPISSC